LAAFSFFWSSLWKSSKPNAVTSTRIGG
jgi:hypothetical protein